MFQTNAYDKKRQKEKQNAVLEGTARLCYYYYYYYYFLLLYKLVPAGFPRAEIHLSGPM